jgi:hypothetical protein
MGNAYYVPHDTVYSVKTLQDFFDGIKIPPEIKNQKVLASNFVFDVRTEEIVQINPPSKARQSILTLGRVLILTGPLDNAYIWLTNEQLNYINSLCTSVAVSTH